MTAPDWRKFDVFCDAVDQSVCECCGDTTRIVRGFALCGDIRARYAVVWAIGRMREHGVNFDINFRLGLNETCSTSLWKPGYERSVALIDADREAFASDPTVRPLMRDDVLGTPSADIIFAIYDAFWITDPRLTEVTGNRFYCPDDEFPHPYNTPTRDDIEIVHCSSADIATPDTGLVCRQMCGEIEIAGQCGATYFARWTLGQTPASDVYFDVVLPDARSNTSDDLAFVTVGVARDGGHILFEIVDACHHREVNGVPVNPLAWRDIIGTPLAEKVLDFAQAIWVLDDRMPVSATR